MDVKDAIGKRRALRSLAPVEITDELVEDLARHAHMAASCFNNQSWRFVFVHEDGKLESLKGSLSRGNAWGLDASLIVVVLSRPDLDCQLKGGRDMWMFDTGMATANLVLRATELGLVAHPIAGYKVDTVREVLGLPEDLTVVTLVIIGKLADEESPRLADWQLERERGPRIRRPLETVLHRNGWHPEQEPTDYEDKGSAFEH